MAPAAKLAIAGGLAGLLLALILAGHASRAAVRLDPVPGEQDSTHPPARPDLARCRLITAPDPVCAAAWEDRRRRFFGTGARP